MDRRTKQHVSIVAMALLGVTLISGVLWYVGQENRFKTYEDKQKRFSLKYPADWSIEEGKQGTAAIFLSQQENDLDYFRENVNIVVQFLDQNKPKQLNKYSKDAIDQMKMVFGEGMIIVDSGQVFFAGQTGYKAVFVLESPQMKMKYMSVWTIKGEYAYQFTYTTLLSQYDLYYPKVKKMIKSFRIK